MSAWKLETTDRFLRSLRKKDKTVAVRVMRDLLRLTELEDPTKSCKALAGPLAGLWRYRAGDWRVIVDIRRNELIILALDVGHRSEIYRSGL